MDPTDPDQDPGTLVYRSQHLLCRNNGFIISYS
jgi:hypothetical protein